MNKPVKHNYMNIVTKEYVYHCQDVEYNINECRFVEASYSYY
jgi:hypothetical protein